MVNARRNSLAQFWLSACYRTHPIQNIPTMMTIDDVMTTKRRVDGFTLHNTFWLFFFFHRETAKNTNEWQKKKINKINKTVDRSLSMFEHTLWLYAMKMKRKTQMFRMRHENNSYVCGLTHALRIGCGDLSQSPNSTIIFLNYLAVVPHSMVAKLLHSSI